MSIQGQEAEDDFENITPVPSERDASLEGKVTGTKQALSQQNTENNDLNDPNSYNPTSAVTSECGEPPPPPPKSPLKNSESASLSRARNVVIFGESGSGKSSVINTIAKQELSVTSGDAAGCTFRSQSHSVEISGHSYELFDTVGLNEATEGTVPAAEAEDNLKNLLHGFLRPGSGGIGLLVYCVRGPRVSRALNRNYNVFYSAICRKKVPIVIVVTGLENQKGTMESWWATNEKELQKYGMHFQDHACVTTLRKEPNTSDVFTQRITESSGILRSLITRNYSEWSVDNSLIKLALAGVRNMIRGRRSEMSSPPVLTICDSSPRELEIADCINGMVQTCIAHIGDVEYQVHHVPQPQASDIKRISSDEERPEADLLIYYARTDEKEVRQRFQTFCAAYGGNVVPVIVVVKGLCDDESTSQWVKSNIVENGTGNLAWAYAPARDPYDNSAREKAEQELRELIRRSHLVRYRGRNAGGFFNLKRFWGRLR